MRLQTIVYTTDMEASEEWWVSVLGSEPDYRSEAWTSFTVGGATLALHYADSIPEAGRIGVSLVTDRSLDDLVAELTERGVNEVGAIVEQPFGRQLPLQDPLGNTVVVNEHRS